MDEVERHPLLLEDLFDFVFERQEVNRGQRITNAAPVGGLHCSVERLNSGGEYVGLAVHEVAVEVLRVSEVWTVAMQVENAFVSQNQTPRPFQQWT